MMNIMRNKNPRYVLLVFGNVDFHIDFILQIQQKKQNALDAEEFVAVTFESYRRFIETLIIETTVIVLIAGVIFPFVENKCVNDAIRKYNFEKIQGTSVSRQEQDETNFEQLENMYGIEIRRRMVTSFNERLKNLCGTLKNVRFIDINRHIVDPITGLVRREFIDKEDPTNIHLLWEPTIRFWIREFRQNDVLTITDDDVQSNLAETEQQYRYDKRKRMRTHAITSRYLQPAEET